MYKLWILYRFCSFEDLGVILSVLHWMHLWWSSQYLIYVRLCVVCSANTKSAVWSVGCAFTKSILILMICRHARTPLHSIGAHFDSEGTVRARTSVAGEWRHLNQLIVHLWAILYKWNYRREWWCGQRLDIKYILLMSLYTMLIQRNSNAFANHYDHMVSAATADNIDLLRPEVCISNRAILPQLHNSRRPLTRFASTG